MLALLAALAVGCDEEPSVFVPYDASASAADGGMFEAGSLTPYVLYYFGLGDVNVDAGADVKVRFLLLEQPALPAAGHEVDFAIDGSGQDSSLDQLSGITDDKGVVEVTIHAGQVPTTFLLRVTCEGAAPQYVTVNVAGGSMLRIVGP